MKSLIEWPLIEDDTEWKDTGEGGLYVYAAWDVSDAENCHVDVHPNITLGSVLVKADGPLAEAFLEQERAYNQNIQGIGQFDDYKFLVETGVLASTVVFLGSTDMSFFDELAGNYFAAQKTNLTLEGAALVDVLEKVYGQATYLTYLDT